MSQRREQNSTIRIGTCSGFYGDRASALAEMAAASNIDVIVGDYLAEVTMLILGKAQVKDPSKGYATTFLAHLEAGLDDIAAKGIKVVVNAGGLNPAGLAAATRDLVTRYGHDLRVAHLEGDNLTGRLDALQKDGHALPHLTTGEPLSSWTQTPMTANAYLGGFGITRALAGGADIVITGRVADASLIVGPAAWWWGWSPHDYDQLAGAIAAGHVIECGTQATGGNFAGFRTIENLDDPGFPIAEIRADGSAVITKNSGTGGAVTADTVTAQLLYEIGDPAYLNSDVTTHLDTVQVTDLGDDRVQISGTRGSAPPVTTKVAITAIGGWQNAMLLALTGPDIDAKEELVRRFVDRYSGNVEGLEATTIDRIGQADDDPGTQNAGTTLLKVSVQGTKDAAGRRFSSHMVELALGGYPGLYFLTPPQQGSAFGAYWPALIDQGQLMQTVIHYDGATETIGTPVLRPEAQAQAPSSVTLDGSPSESVSSSFEETVQAALGDLVYARSGDKGGDANIGVWVNDEAAWGWIKHALTVEELRRLLPETQGLDVARYELPNLRALNFVISGLLGAGATSSLRLDAQGKGLGEWLRSRHMSIPKTLLHRAPVAVSPTREQGIVGNFLSRGGTSR